MSREPVRPASPSGMALPRPVVSGAVAKFLGPASMAAGPFSMLGLSPESCTDATILAAVDRQLDRLATHPEAETPEADEVRLAIHAAAAQLLDPPTRKQLVEQWPRTVGSGLPISAPSSAVLVSSATMAVRELGRTSNAPTTVTASPLSPALSRPAIALDDEARQAMAMHGGWNPRAQATLHMLARAKGAGPRDVAAWVARRPQARSSATAGAASAVAAVMPAIASPGSSRLQVASPTRVDPDQREAQRRADTWETADPGLKVLRNAILVGLAAVLAIGIGLTVLLMMLTRPATTGPVDDEVSAREARVPAGERGERVPGAELVVDGARAGEDSASLAKPSAMPAASLENVQADLMRAASVALSTPEAASDAFSTRVRVLAAGWPAMPRDRLVAANDAVLGYVFRVADRPSLLTSAMRAIAERAAPLSRGVDPAKPSEPEDVASSIWAAGVLARLSGERELPASARLIVQQELAASIGQAQSAIEPSFEAGASAAIYAWPARLTRASVPGSAEKPMHQEAAWRAWAVAAKGLAADAPSLRDRFVLAGLEHVLLTGPEASKDAGVRTTVGELVPLLDWRTGSEARAWVLRAFLDDRLTNGDLSVVTGVLALASSAQGIDPSMVLSPGADEQARLMLRDRYAEAWGVRETVDRNELLQRVRSAVESAVAAGDEARDPAAHLASAVRLSRLSEAAWWIWRGEREAGDAILEDRGLDLEQILTIASREPETSILAGGSRDGEWALRYKSLGNNPRSRLELLDGLARAGAVGPVDAEMLAAEAFFGQPAEVRSKAADVLGLLGGSPAVVNAALEALPRVVKNPANTRLIEGLTQSRLPSPRDARWPIEARRVLVERLLQMAASGSETRAIDRLSKLLIKSHANRALGKPPGEGDRAAGSVAAAHASVFSQWGRWRREADALIPRAYVGLTLAQIETRRSSRVGSAQGLVETFAAEQASLCEMMAYVIVGERPERAGEVAALMGALGERRRASRHVLEQVQAVEACVARLWMLRLEGGRSL
jgi:hypothetical protein